MSSAPAASPPAGQTANFANPETTHRETGLVLSAIGMAFMTTIMLLRLYTKTYMVRLFDIDDVFAVLAWIASVTLQCLFSYTWASKYLGTHIWDLTVTEYNTFSTVMSICNIAYICTTALAKTALLLSYRKLWLVRWFKITTFAVMAFIFSYSTALGLGLIFACVPLKKNWDITMTDGSCVNKTAMYIAAAAFSSTTDVLLFILPLPMVYKLRLKPCQKAGMVVVLAIGSMTVCISLVWLAMFIPVIQGEDKDTSWELSKISVWVAAEANLVLICGCFPALKLLARRIVPKWFGSERVRSVGGLVVMPPPWQSELRTVTTGFSGNSNESNESSGSTGGAQNLAKGFRSDSGTMFGYHGSSIERTVTVEPGRVLPEP